MGMEGWKLTGGKGVEAIAPAHSTIPLARQYFLQQFNPREDEEKI